jgi:hypothetical protein
MADDSLALRHCLNRFLLVEHLNVTQMARGVARPPDAVRVGRIELDPSRIRLDDRQREFRPGFRLGIEAGDFVRRLFGQPDPGNGVMRDGNAVPAKVDLLGVLDAWADLGTAPDRPDAGKPARAGTV